MVEEGWAGSITGSFLGLRCLSPSGGCREVKYPKNAPGGVVAATREVSQQRGGCEEPGQPSWGLWAVSSPKIITAGKISKIKTGVKAEHSSASSLLQRGLRAAQGPQN